VRSHLADLAALGIEGDGAAVRSSQRFDRYEAALARLRAEGLLYPCYCTRREVQAAVAAPHGPLPEGGVPGHVPPVHPGRTVGPPGRGAPQVWLARRPGLAPPAYAHVPLVLGPDGQRLAKRHGAVTLADLRAGGAEPPAVLAAMAASLGLGSGVATVADLLPGFVPERLSREPWRFDPRQLMPVNSQ
jgi:glutamyl/glutaminyl-tRNA synthetase